MGWILSLFYFALIIFLLPRIPFVKRSGLKPNEIRLVFSLKVLAGFALWAIYFFYYGNDRVSADAFRFFDDALIIYGALLEQPLVYVKIISGIGMNDPEVVELVDQLNNWYKPYNQGVYNDNQSIIRFNAICMLFSFGFFHVHTVLINLISFLGLMGIYRILKKELRLHRYALIASVFLIPQVWLWGSGVLKEGLVLGAIGLLFFGIWHLLVYRCYRTQNIAAALLGLGGLLLVKNYLLLCLLPAFLFLILDYFVPRLKIWFAATISAMVSVIGLMVLSQVESIALLEKLVSKQVDFIRLGIMSDSGSYFEIPRLKPELFSFIKAAPEAMMNVLFRPFIGDADSLLAIFSSIEAMIIALLIFIALVPWQRGRIWNSKIFYFGLFFSVSLFLLIGLVTPVAGAIVRYKIPALIFIVPIALNFLPKRINEKILNH